MGGRRFTLPLADYRERKWADPLNAIQLDSQASSYERSRWCVPRSDPDLLKYWEAREGLPIPLQELPFKARGVYDGGMGLGGWHRGWLENLKEVTVQSSRICQGRIRDSTVSYQQRIVRGNQV